MPQCEKEEGRKEGKKGSNEGRKEGRKEGKNVVWTKSMELDLVITHIEALCSSPKRLDIGNFPNKSQTHSKPLMRLVEPIPTPKQYHHRETLKRLN